MPSRLIKPRRAAQAEPAQSEQFYRQLAETIPHMVWTARPDGSADYFNARVYEYTGRSQQELVDWGWRAMVHPDDWERCLARWTKAFKKGQPYEVEYRLQRHDGRYLWHLGAAMPLRHDGRIVRWCGTSTDIENQKRAEQLLAKARRALETLVDGRSKEQHLDQQERFRAFLNSMPAIAWIKDSNFRYAWTSASYSRVHGRAFGEMEGRDDFEVWPEPMARHFREDDEKALRVNGPVQSIDSVPVADGVIARWLVVKFPLPDGSGALGVAGIGFDISARDSDETASDGLDAGSPLRRLSGRERQVLQMIVDGSTSVQVGLRLGLSPKSVDTYRSRIMAKLDIGDLPTLVKFAIRHRITTAR